MVVGEMFGFVVTGIVVVGIVVVVLVVVVLVVVAAIVFVVVGAFMQTRAVLCHPSAHLLHSS